MRKSIFAIIGCIGAVFLLVFLWESLFKSQIAKQALLKFEDQYYEYNQTNSVPPALAPSWIRNGMKNDTASLRSACNDFGSFQRGVALENVFVIAKPHFADGSSPIAVMEIEFHKVNLKHHAPNLFSARLIFQNWRWQVDSYNFPDVR